jgi:hypothetical protein
MAKPWQIWPWTKLVIFRWLRVLSKPTIATPHRLSIVLLSDLWSVARTGCWLPKQNNRRGGNRVWVKKRKKASWPSTLDQWTVSQRKAIHSFFSAPDVDVENQTHKAWMMRKYVWKGRGLVFSGLKSGVNQDVVFVCRAWDRSWRECDVDDEDAYETRAIIVGVDMPMPGWWGGRPPTCDGLKIDLLPGRVVFSITRCSGSVEIASRVDDERSSPPRPSF